MVQIHVGNPPVSRAGYRYLHPVRVLEREDSRSQWAARGRGSLVPAMNEWQAGQRAIKSDDLTEASALVPDVTH